MSEWQPIETAPKDQSILVWDGVFCSVAKWFHVYSPSMNRMTKSGNWGDWYCMNTIISPTHWMPLPEPPKGET